MRRSEKYPKASDEATRERREKASHEAFTLVPSVDAPTEAKSFAKDRLPANVSTHAMGGPRPPSFGGGRHNRPEPVNAEKMARFRSISWMLFGASLVFPVVAPLTIIASLLAYGASRYYSGYGLKSSLARMAIYAGIFFGLPIAFSGAAMAATMGTTLAALIIGSTLVGLAGLGVVALGYILTEKFSS